MSTSSYDLLPLPRTQERAVELPDEGIVLSLRVTRIANDLYRIEEVPFGAESLGFRDLVRTTLVDGRLRIVRVVQPSGWTVVELGTDVDERGAQGLEHLIATAVARGGQWVPFTRGRVVVCLPPGLELRDLEAPVNERDDRVSLAG